MGILCQSCRLLLYDIEPIIIKNKDKDEEIPYPKSFVSIPLEGKKT